MTSNQSRQFQLRNIHRIILFLLLLTACSGENLSLEPITVNGTGKLKVVATTTIVYDVVKQVGGDLIELEVLLPIGVDPHSFDPAPRDIAKLAQAEILFFNGAGLETFLDPLVKSSGGNFQKVDLSSEIQLIRLVDNQGSIDDQTSGEFDPHVWMDPNNVIVWVNQISEILSDFDPENSYQFETNAKKYSDSLEGLDKWIVTQVEQIPPGQRKFITDHLVFGYFVKAYGFIQMGAILPTFDNLSQPSAQEMATLEDLIRTEEIKAILVGANVNPNLALRIAEDTGIQLVYVYTDTLTEEGGPADNYIDLIQYDVEAIVSVLR